MRFEVLVAVSTGFGLLLLSGVSCSPVGNGTFAAEGLAKRKADSDAIVAQISPAEVKVSGSLVVIIPTDESLVRTFMVPRPGQKVNDFTLQVHKNKVLTMVEAVRARHAFDSVQCRPSADPERESFDEDFALIYPAQMNLNRRDLSPEWDRIFSFTAPDWLLKVRQPSGREPVPIEYGPSSLSLPQQMAIWLDNIETAAKRPAGIGIWYKMVGQADSPWVSNASSAFCTARKGETCVRLKVETGGAPAWAVSDPSVVSLEPAVGPEVEVKALKGGKVRITVSAGSSSKTLYCSVTERERDLWVTFSEE
jgi:hypothetical protein